VAVVGGDFPRSALQDLRRRGVDLDGLQVVEEGLTFRWKGRYHQNMDARDTLETHLNVFESFVPRLPPAYRSCPALFLANIQPGLQREVLDQMSGPRLVGLDTMNLWIETAREELERVLRRVDILVINEEEARQLAEEHNLVRAAKKICALGPRTLVIKRGGYGALLVHGEDFFSVPALPLDQVVDPTGAGDTFAGGFMGFLARSGDPTPDTLRKAMVYGSVLASFCVQGFSYDALANLDAAALQDRFQAFVRLTAFGRAEL
jgi:sugar/nucleoside kinase (ribokinase family)